MQMVTIRNWQFAQLENNIKSITALVNLTDPHLLTTYRDGGNGWTVLEALCHLRDFENVFLDRARVTLEQENAPLPAPSPDAMATEHRYNEQSVADVLAEWKTRRTNFIAFMRDRSESDWERIGLHPVRGPLTLLEQLMLAAMHDTIHLEQMTRTLSEKKLM